MAQSSIMERLILKRLQVEENSIKSNQFYISPDLQVQTVIHCNQRESDTDYEIVFNFDDLLSCSLFLNFIHGQQTNSRPTFAFITGIPGIGKSQFLIELEKFFWKQFQKNLDFQIAPLKMILNKFSDIRTQNFIDQQILEYFELDQFQLQQLKEQINNENLELIFLIDLSFNIQTDEFPQFFQFLEQLNQQWKECKIIISINQYKKCKNEVRKKVCRIFQNSLGIVENSTSISNNINKITSLFLQALDGDSKTTKENQLFLEQMEQLIYQSNMSTNIQNELIEIFEKEMGQIWSMQQYQSYFSKLHINRLIRIPFILKLFLEIVPTIDYVEVESQQFDVIEKLFQRILQIENFKLDEQGRLKQIYLFALSIFETEVFIKDQTIKEIFEIISSLSNNPFKNTNYLNHLWNSKAFVEFFIASYIHEKIIMVKSEEIMEIENAQQQCYELQEEDLFFINSFDMKIIHIYQKIKLFDDFDKLIISSPKYSGVLKYLKEKCWLDKLKVEKLLNMIKASSVIENFEQEAGNAFTILKELKGIFQREDFSKIKLKNFSLDGIKFYECNFSFSQMNNFSIYNTEFIGCSLDYAKWQNINSLIIEATSQDGNIQFSRKTIVNPQKSDNQNKLKLEKIEQKKKRLLSYYLHTEVLLSLSNYSIYLIKNKDYSYSHFTISWIFNFGERELCKKILGHLLHVKYFGNDLIIIKTNRHLKYYNVKNWKLLRKFSEDDWSKTYLSSDQKIKAIVLGQKIILYSTITLKEIAQFTGNTPCLFAPKHPSIFIFSNQKQVSVLDLQNNKISHIPILVNSQTKYFAVSHDLILIISCGQNQLGFWDLKKGGQFLTLFEFPQIIKNIELLNDGNILKVESRNTFILDTKEIKHSYLNEFCSSNFSHLALSNNVLAVCTYQEEIFFWNFQFGKMLDKLSDESLESWNIKIRTKIFQSPEIQNQIKQIILSSDGLLVAVAYSDNTVLIFNIQDRQIKQKLEIQTAQNSIVFSPDNQELLAGGNDGQISITNIQSKVYKVIHKHKKPIQLVMFQSQSSILYCTDTDFILWNIQNNEQLDKFSNQNRIVIQTYSKDQIVYFDGYEQKIVQINEKIKQLNGIDIFRSLNIVDEKYSISPNTNIFATTQQVGNYLKTVRLQNLNRIKLKQKFETTSKVKVDLQFYDSLPIAINFNLNIIASGTESGNIDLWSRLNGQLLLKLVQHTSTVECLDFSPAQPILASGSMDKTIILWNIESGSLINILKEHEEGVTCIAFSKDGKFLASGGLDFIINIWEVQNLKIDKKLQVHKSKIVSVSFSPNGLILASAELFGVINLWDVQRKSQISINKIEEIFLWMKFRTNNKTVILTKNKIIQWNVKFPLIQYNSKKFETQQIYALKKAVFLQQTKKLIVYGNYLQIFDPKTMKFDYEFGDRQLTINPYFLHYSAYDKKKEIIQPTYTIKNKNNTVIIYDILQKKELLQLKNYQKFPIASSISNWDKSLYQWNLQTDSKMNQIDNIGTQINYLKFSQKGDLLACRTFEKIIILLNQNLQEVNKLQLTEDCVSEIFISPDSQWIIFGVLGSLYLWKSNQTQFTWKQILYQQDKKQLASVKFAFRWSKFSILFFR